MGDTTHTQKRIIGIRRGIYVVGLLLSMGFSQSTNAAFIPELLEQIAKLVSKNTDAPIVPPAPGRYTHNPHIPSEPPKGTGEIPTHPWEYFRSSESSIETLTSHPSQSVPGRKELLKGLSKAFTSTLQIIYTSAEAKKFGKDFLVGAKEGQTRLGKLDKKLNPIVEPWLKAQEHKRVFVIAPSQSHPDVTLLKSALRAQGYEMFFYKFCEPILSKLCGSEDVGAFFATAGHVIAITSKHSESSAYIPVELAVAHKHAEGGLLIVFTPSDLRRLTTVTSTGLYVATLDLVPEEKRKRGKKG